MTETKLQFTVTQYVKDYIKIGDEWRNVEVECKYTCHNFDDLENLLLTLIENKNDIKFRVRTEEVIG